MLETLKLAEIITGHTQFRAAENPATVAEYADAMQAGETFPPIVVWRVGAELHLSDGYHRLAALRKLGRDTVQADVREGSALELFEHALGANARHGLPRTQEDKRKAVRAALAHPELSQRSDTQIAKLCGVSQPFVSGLRRTLSGSSTPPKKADDIQHILDLPALEQWARVLPTDDKRKDVVLKQIRLIKAVLHDRHEPPRWGLTEPAFPKWQSLKTAWITSTTADREPAVVQLWLLWLDAHPEPPMLAEDWSKAFEAASDYAELWKLAAQPDRHIKQRIKALRAGVQLLWIHEVWSIDTLDTLEPVTLAVRDAAADRRLKLTPSPRKVEDGPPEPKISEVNVEQWWEFVKRVQQMQWLYSYRTELLKRAHELQIPMRRCLACDKDTVAALDKCLDCYRGHKDFLGQVHTHLREILLVASRMNGPLWAGLRYLRRQSIGERPNENVLEGLQLLAEVQRGIPDLDRAWDEVFVPEDKGLDDEGRDDDDTEDDPDPAAEGSDDGAEAA